jgi:hypothetical protein
MFLLEILCIFGAGLLQDALNTAYVRAIAEKARPRATVLSGIVTVTGVLVFTRILGHFGELETAGSTLFAYALGNSAGTWVGMRRGVPA